MSLPATTVVPFASLPSCATNCGPLYDANGACVPPAVPSADASTYNACFCNVAKLQPSKTATAGVCDSACSGDGTGLGKIQNWYASFCNGKAVATATATGSTTSATSASSSGSSSGSTSSSSQASGDWLSGHWKWVVFIVVVVVAIIGIWTGACIWRRRYLKKKDRMYELGKGLPSTIAVNTQGNLVGPGVQNGSRPGSFVPGPAPAGLSEKPRKERQRWNVSERT